MSPLKFFNSQPKRLRKRKTTEEKIRTAADRYLLELIKRDESILRALIKKIYGIDIPSEAERRTQQIIEETRLRALKEASDTVLHDPEFREEMRDKCIADLLGRPATTPRNRGQGNFPPRRNPRAPMENLVRDIKMLRQLEKELGINEDSWTKVFQNPEVIKGAIGLIQYFLGSGRPTPAVNTDGDSERFVARMEVDGKTVEMNKEQFMDYLAKLGTPGLSRSGNTEPSNGQPPNISVSKDTAATPNDDRPELQTQETQTEPKGIAPPIPDQPESGGTLKVLIDRIISAMDQPAEEFARKILQSSRCRDRESMQIRDFILANDYDAMVHELSQYRGYAERLEAKREWYDQVTAALQT